VAQEIPRDAGQQEMGANTMQIDSVETKAGVAICGRAVEEISSMSSLVPPPDCGLMFSTSTVASSTQDADGQAVHERHNIDRFSDTRSAQ